MLAILQPSLLFVLLIVTLIAVILIMLAKRRAAPALYGKRKKNALHGGQNKPTDHTQADKTHAFTVGTYNIHRARGIDGIKSLRRIAKTIEGIDIVGLNECEGPPALFKYKSKDQSTMLGRMLSTNAIFSPTQKRWGRYDRGNGLISRFPISSWYQEPLVDSTATHPRCLLRADILIDETIIPIFVTHLARRIDVDIQLKTVIARFAQFKRAILLGDLNLNEAYPQLKSFLDDANHCDAIKVNQLSSLEGNGDHPERIDWIISKGFDVIDGGHSAASASDHPFYWVKLCPSQAITPL